MHRGCGLRMRARSFFSLNQPPSAAIFLIVLSATMTIMIFGFLTWLQHT
jgi:hypothetical protein